ncbi:hypothetical protein F503_01728 [Ophiostoma piceae UAMH 11346]|uniref:Uncharacterized protein n=1 Tax=Ophiostoma piceae (strain UAMH 11346) TaxID=1262450 RepID=S3CC34_OPHP1|nr:hypothetical protein F503_01728 [Ophiostoma piceae UAMH 11346]
MICSAFSRGPCHGRSRSTNTCSNIPKTYDSSDDEAGIWTGNYNGNNTYMYHRTPDATNPSTPRYAPSLPMTPKSATSKSITGFHVRRRYHNQTRDDLAGRRRSANADILESLGLPSMVSFQDMKTLQDGLSEEDILGRHKSHRRQSSRRVSVCLSTYNDCFRGAATIVGDNAAQVTMRASQSLSSVARWTRKVTPPSIHLRLQKKHNHDQVPSATVGSDADKEGKDDTVMRGKHLHSSASKADRKNQSFLPNQWIRQRSAYAEETADEKTL